MLQNFPYCTPIMLHCALLCSKSSLSCCCLSLKKTYFSIYMHFKAIENTNSNVHYLTNLLEYIDLFQKILSYLLDLCSQNTYSKTARITKHMEALTHLWLPSTPAIPHPPSHQLNYCNSPKLVPCSLSDDCF